MTKMFQYHGGKSVSTKSPLTRKFFNDFVKVSGLEEY